MTTIASLAVDFATNTAEIANDLGKVRKSFESTINGIKNIAATAFATFVTSEMISQPLELANSLKDLQDQAGFSAERLQELRFAAGQNTVPMQDLDAAVLKFSQTVGEAANGNKTAAAAFSNLGVSVVDSTGHLKTNDQILNDVADRMAKVASQSQRTAIATDLFGKNAGPGMAVLLKQGSAGLAQYAQQARDTGSVLSNELVEGAAKAAGDLQTFKTVTFSAFSNGFLQEIAADFGLVGDSMSTTAEVSKNLGQSFGRVVNAAAELGQGIYYVVEPIGELLGGMQSLKIATVTIINAIKLGFLSLQETIVTVAGGVVQSIVWIDEAYTTLMNKLGKHVNVDQGFQDFLEALKLEQQDLSRQITDLSMTGIDELAKASDQKRDVVLKNMAEVQKASAAASGSIAAQKVSIIGNSDASKIKDVIDALKFRNEQMTRTNEEQDIYNNLQKAGVAINSQAGQQIVGLTHEYYQYTEAQKRGKEVTDAIARANDTALDRLIDGLDDGKIGWENLAQAALEYFKTLATTRGSDGTYLGGSILSSLFGTVASSAKGMLPSYDVGAWSVRGDQLAQIHDGEMIVPKPFAEDLRAVGGLGGGDININVIDNVGVGVKATQSARPGGGRDITIQLDEAVAKLQNDPSSRLRRAQNKSTALIAR